MTFSQKGAIIVLLKITHINRKGRSTVMKNNLKKLISGILAVGMCITATGCGGSSDDSGSEKSGKSKKTGTFYDSLDSEWDKHGRTGFVKLAGNNGSSLDFVYNNGNIFFQNTVDSAATLYCFDMKAMETKELTNLGTDGVGEHTIYFCDGFFYDYKKETNNFIITKYDSDGNEIGSSPKTSTSYEFIGAAADGYVFLCKEGELKVIAPDMTAAQDLSEVKVPDSHGNDSDVKKLSLKGSYNNKSYFGVTFENGDAGLAILDTSSMTWSGSSCNSDSDDSRSVGKYLLTSSSVIDMEKDEYLVNDLNMITERRTGEGRDGKITTSHTYASIRTSYYGGASCIVKSENGWGTITFESGAKDIDRSAIKVFPDKISVDTRVDDKYFIFSDNSGYYLREYTNGETDIATVLLKN